MGVPARELEAQLLNEERASRLAHRFEPGHAGFCLAQSEEGFVDETRGAQVVIFVTLGRFF